MNYREYRNTVRTLWKLGKIDAICNMPTPTFAEIRDNPQTRKSERERLYWVRKQNEEKLEKERNKRKRRQAADERVVRPRGKKVSLFG